MDRFVRRVKAPESDSGATDNEPTAVKKRKVTGNSDSNSHDSGTRDTPTTSYPCNSSGTDKPKQALAKHVLTPKLSQSASAASKPVRKFVESWRHGRAWLDYDKKAGLMHCMLCRQFADATSKFRCGAMQKRSSVGDFVKGSSNFKISTVRDREDSPGHRYARQLKTDEDYRVAGRVAQTPAGEALQQLKSSEREPLRNMLRNAHAVAVSNRPLSDYNYLNALDKAKGLQINSAYQNAKACGAFVDCIASVYEDSLMKYLSQSHFFSLTMDGTTDISAKEQESLFVRASLNGVVSHNFLRFVEPESTASNDLFVVVEDTLAILVKFDIDVKHKLTALGSDGASNMLGTNKGVGKLLKDKYPDMKTVHCLAHRLELAIKDAVKASGTKQYEKLMTALIGLYYFYKRSSKQRKGLRKAMQVLELTGSMPPRVGGTRWLSHTKRAIESVLQIYQALVFHLENESHWNAKAEGLVKLLTNRETMAFMVMIKVTYYSSLPIIFMNIWGFICLFLPFPSCKPCNISMA